jgi:hypothetical protein
VSSSDVVAGRSRFAVASVMRRPTAGAVPVSIAKTNASTSARWALPPVNVNTGRFRKLIRLSIAPSCVKPKPARLTLPGSARHVVLPVGVAQLRDLDVLGLEQDLVRVHLVVRPVGSRWQSLQRNGPSCALFKYSFWPRAGLGPLRGLGSERSSRRFGFGP